MNVVDFPAVALADAVGLLAATPALLEEALAQAGASRSGVQPRPGEFSLREHACHLRDVDRDAYLVRVRRVLSEDRPALAGFDGAAVAASRNYAAQDALAAADEFSAARRELVAMLARLSEAQLAREATFGGKPTCLADLVAMMVEHDQGHAAEIQGLLRTLG